MKILRRTLGEFPRKEEKNSRQRRTSKPKPLQIPVNRTIRKDTLWSNHTPHNRVSEEYASIGTGILILLLCVTDIGNIPKRPEEHSDLDEATPECGDDLAAEKGAGWNLHVQSNLEGFAEGDGLGEGIV